MGDCALCHVLPDPRKHFPEATGDKVWKASREAYRLPCMKASINTGSKSCI